MRILFLFILCLSGSRIMQGEVCPQAMYSFDRENCAKLHLFTGEHYLVHKEYKKALESFKEALVHLQGMTSENSLGIAFRAVLGQIVSYDNLSMFENISQEMQQLQTIISQVPHCHCERFDQSSRSFADPSSCEEIITGAGKALEGIASLVQNSALRTVLLGIIEGLVSQGISCCRTGNFWQACISPIVDIWKDWKGNPQKLPALAETRTLEERLHAPALQLQDVPVFYTGSPLRGLLEFTCIFPSTLQNKEQIHQTVEQELGSIGKVSQMTSDDVSGFSAGNVLTLQIGSLTTWDQKELPFTRVTLSVETPVIVDKTQLKTFPRVWSINCFIDAPLDQEEEQLVGAVKKLLKDFTRAYQLVNQDILKPTFYVYY